MYRYSSPRRRALALITSLAASIVIAPTQVHAAKDSIYTKLLSNMAVEGHDTVAYFTQGKPVKGLSNFSTEYKGATWQFASQENLDLFLSDPEKYAPAYGGYCAYAVAQGYTAKGDPEQWEIHENRLYLNFNASIQTRWSADKLDYIAKSESNWPGVLE